MSLEIYAPKIVLLLEILFLADYSSKNMANTLSKMLIWVSFINQS